MILTTVDHLQDYAALNSHFPGIFSALQEKYASDFIAGKTLVDGQNAFINSVEYLTKTPAESQMEAHKKYIDVMVMLEGTEEIGVSDVRALSRITQAYDPETDLLLAKPEPDYQALVMRKGTVCILFPEDAHAAGMLRGEAGNVRKLVGKVRAETK